MASGVLWVYLGVLPGIAVVFMALGAGVHRRKGRRGALVGLIPGVLIAP